MIATNFQRLYTHVFGVRQHGETGWNTVRYRVFPIYFLLLAATFDFQHTHTPDSNSTRLSVLPDPENMGIAVEILLLL